MPTGYPLAPHLRATARKLRNIRSLAQREAAGICIRCSDPAEVPFKSCRACLDKQAANARAWKARRKAAA